MFPTNLQESTFPFQASGSAITLLGEFAVPPRSFGIMPLMARLRGVVNLFPPNKAEAEIWSKNQREKV
jgi:hypothetical protein